MSSRVRHKKYTGILIFVLLILIAASAAIVSPLFRKSVKPVVEASPSPKPKVEVKLPQYAMQEVKGFPFSEQDSLREWDEKVFKGRVRYGVAKDDSLSYVQAASDAAASALYYKINLDPGKDPIISWRWRAEKFPDKKQPENLELQSEHDFAARVYIIFPTTFLLNSRVLEYIWAENLPVGTTGTSPYSKHIKLMVLQSGAAPDGQWRFEERDIVADYTKLFGKPPDRNIGAVAFMTNAEHTHSSDAAEYDDIKLGYKETKPGKGNL